MAPETDCPISRLFVRMAKGSSSNRRYVTEEAGFLSECVGTTIEKTFPAEIAYLESYDRASRRISNLVEMPNNMIGYLIVQLDNNGGRIPNKRRRNEYEDLTDQEVVQIEALVREEFKIEDDNPAPGP